jgi:histidine triad (HIT) family protein
MCIFCDIVSGAIPAYKVYEDDRVLAFLDIKPVNPGHALVISKAHYPNLETVPAEELTAVILAVQQVGRLLKDKLGIVGYNVTENNDPVAGQDIPHLHFHVIPRHQGDGNLPWRQAAYNPGEAEEIIKKLTA